jgi:hypothetical protein
MIRDQLTGEPSGLRHRRRWYVQAFLTEEHTRSAEFAYRPSYFWTEAAAWRFFERLRGDFGPGAARFEVGRS